MDLLPPASARSDLLDALALVVARSGFEPFAFAPLLFPDATFFPEPWEPSARGVRLLSLRLLAYAGLDELDARVTLYSNLLEHQASELGEHAIEGAAAWFAGIDGDTCIFGAETRELDDGDAIVGVMCHEVAHAFRHAHDLETTTRAIEEQLTDVTTIYLGFGVLTLNSAYRARSAALPRATTLLAGSTLSVSQRGYLSIQALAYLLAAQALARNATTKAKRRIAEALGPNQRACFEAACDELGDDAGAMCVRLGLPPPEAWPEPPPFELPELREDAHFVPERGPQKRPFNEGKDVFRVERSQAAGLAVGGTVAGALSLGLLGAHLGLPGVGSALGGASVGLVLGAALGGRVARFTCSDPKCEASQATRALAYCPRCGGAIRATLRAPADRLEAEDCIEQGRSLDELERDLDARHARWRRRARIAVGAFAALFAWGAWIELVPTRTSVVKLRSHAELLGSYVVLDGEVLEAAAGDGMTSPEGTLFVAFRFGDGTDTMLVFYDPSAAHPSLVKGARVRVRGKYEEIRVSGQPRTRFVAAAVE